MEVQTPTEEGRRRLFHDLACLLGHAVDLELGEKARHSLRVAVLAREVARVLGAAGADAFYGGLLHDVGQVVARAGHPVGHTRHGAGLLRPYASLRWLEPVVAHHHERWDGDGEPRGLSGFDIPRAAAIVALADGIDETVRETAPGARQARAVRAVLAMRDASVAAEVAEAGLQLLDTQPDLLETLFDAASLGHALRVAPDDPPRLPEDVGELEIVAELSWLVARVADARHPHRVGHSARVAFLAHDIAVRLGGVDRWDVACAALLHDVGKLFVPATVLRKRTPLVPGELAAIHGHAEHTRRTLERIERLAPLASAAAAHHEAWDGSGYPRGSSGEAIPLIARIIAYADVYDALTHARAHRAALDPDAALATVRALVGQQLDPGLAPHALSALAEAREESSHDLLGFRAFFAAARPRVDLAGPMQQLVFAHRNFLHTREAVVFTDERARVLDVNFAFTRLFGYGADEVLGKAPASIGGGVEDHELSETIRDALDNPEVGAFSGELPVATKAGQRLFVQLGINAVRDAAGAVVGYVATAADVTARRQAQEELAAREHDLRKKNEELEQLARFKGQMVAITSHDLRSPLASIIQTADRLAEECRTLSHEEAQRRLTRLSGVGHDLMRLVTDLLDLDKLEAGRLSLRRRPIHPGALVEMLAASPLADGRVTVTASGAPPICADAERLEQSLQNLVTNALRYSGRDAVVEVGVAVDEEGVRFWVDDRGPGIPPGAEEQIFDRYRQLEGAHPSAGGHGLGLAIVRHLAELHGGRVWAEPRPDGGSRFVLAVPSGGDGASALLIGPDGADLRRIEQAVAGRGLFVAWASRPLDVERRLSVEAPVLCVVDEAWLDEPTLAALARARRAGASIALVSPTAGPRPPWCDLLLERPVAAVELSPILRSVRPSMPPPPPPAGATG